jgi:aspartyl-tRNA(Asn)/glutamyl-tRNA(Gln) amidotransferase subunit C
MKITKQTVEHVARLARLEITETEKEAFSQQLSNILTYVEKLNALNTEGVEPTATVLGQTNVFREDKPRPSLPVERALAGAPEQAGGFFVVPKIINEAK